MPQLRGAAEQGRLIYLLDITKQEVVLLWIYTHAEFEKRPPEQNLKRLLLEMYPLNNSGRTTHSGTILRHLRCIVEQFTPDY